MTTAMNIIMSMRMHMHMYINLGMVMRMQERARTTPSVIAAVGAYVALAKAREAIVPIELAVFHVAHLVAFAVAEPRRIAASGAALELEGACEAGACTASPFGSQAVRGERAAVDGPQDDAAALSLGVQCHLPCTARQAL